VFGQVILIKPNNINKQNSESIPRIDDYYTSKIKIFKENIHSIFIDYSC